MAISFKNTKFPLFLLFLLMVYQPFVYAETVQVQGNQDPSGNQWVDTGVTVTANQPITITATGRVSYGMEGTLGFSPYTDADGNRYSDLTSTEQIDPKPGDNTILPTSPVGALIGVILNNGVYSSPFPLGTEVTFTPSVSGQLLLAYNDVPGSYSNNTGSYTVMIEPVGNSESDTVSPTISTMSPANGGIEVSTTRDILITFDENIKSGANYPNIGLTHQDGQVVPITKSINGNVLNLNPDESLQNNTRYILSIPQGAVQDLAGNPFTPAGERQISYFTTNSGTEFIELMPYRIIVVGWSDIYYDTFYYHGEIDKSVHLLGGTLKVEEGDLHIHGDLKIMNGTLDLQGHTLTVDGDLIQSGGTVNVNNGTLIVKGSYLIQSQDLTSYSTGTVLMSKPQDHILVQGNFVMDSSNDHRGSFNEGILEIKGDFRQKSSYDYWATAYNFGTGGNHKVMLSGEGIQNVYFEDPGSSHFNFLQITNSLPGGIVFHNEMNATELVPWDGELFIKARAVSQYTSTTLKGNLTVEPVNGYVRLEGQTLDLQGHQLTIKGDLIHSGGYLNIRGGTLSVKGSYLIQSADLTTYSSGSLIMTTENDMVKVDGNFVQDSSNDHRGSQTDGTLEVKGNFRQKSTYDYWATAYNFSTSGKHKVILSGTVQQEVNFEDPRESFFTILHITNNAEEGVVFTTPIGVDTLYSHGIKLTGFTPIGRTWTLTDNEVIPGDLNLYANVDLNGKTLTIEGDIIHSAGNMYVHGGELIVKGDYRIQTPVEEGYTYSTGTLQMLQVEDQVLVEGNFVMDSSNDHRGSLNDGVLEVKGDFSQKSTYDYWATAYNFSTSNAQKVLLSGTDEQRISFEDPSASFFTILEIKNQSDQGIVFTTPIGVDYLYSHGKKLTGFTPIERTWTLTDNETIPGDMNLYANVNLNGKTLTIEGDIIHSAGVLHINGGKLIVKGNYWIQTPTETGYTYSTGSLQMTNPNDYVQVEGSFLMDSSNDHRGSLTDGTLEVQGDFTQKSTYDYWATAYNFSTSGKYKVLLSGASKQTIYFENPAESFFTILDIMNTADEGVYFATPIGVDELYSHGKKLTGFTPVARTWKLTSNEVIPGNLTLSTNLDLNGYTLTIEGDLIQTTGLLLVHGGNLVVKGNYLIQTPTENSYIYSAGTLQMTDPNDTVQVSGNFVMDSSNDHRGSLTEGTLEVHGDFIQKSTYDYWATAYNFSTSGKFKVVLNGLQGQTVSFEDPIESYFTVLEITNTSEEGVIFSTPIGVDELYSHGKRLNGFTPVGRTWKLMGDEVILGDLRLSTNLDLNGNTLTIEDNLTHTTGLLHVNGGKLIVRGNYLIETPKEGGMTYSTGILQMTNADDYVEVQGDYVMDSSNDHRGYLTEGTLEVWGDFTQRSTYDYWATAYNFSASNQHKVLLAGLDQQTVSFEDPDNSFFSILEIANYYEGRVIFATHVNYSQLLKQEASSLAVTETNPTHMTERASINSSITIRFDRMIEKDADFDSISVKDFNGSAVEVTKTISSDTLSLQPNNALNYGTSYTVMIPIHAVKDAMGNTIAEEYSFQFATERASSRHDKNHDGIVDLFDWIKSIKMEPDAVQEIEEHYGEQVEDTEEIVTETE